MAAKFFWNRIITITQDFVLRIWSVEGTCLNTIDTQQAHGEQLTNFLLDPGNNWFETPFDVEDQRGRCCLVTELYPDIDQEGCYYVPKDMYRTYWTDIEDNYVRITQYPSGKRIGFIEHGRKVNSVKFLTRSVIIKSSDDGTIKIWNRPVLIPLLLPLLHEIAVIDAQLLKPLLTLFHESAVIDARFLWNRIVTITQDFVVRIWDFDGTCLKSIRTAQAHSDKINSLVIDEDNEIFVTCSSDQTAKIWDLEGNCLATLPHTGAVYVAQLVTDKVGRGPLNDTLITISTPDVLRAWDLGLLLFPSKITSAEILFLNRVYQAMCSGTKLESEDEKRLQAIIYGFLSSEKGSALLQKLAPSLTKSNQSKL